MTTIPNKSKKMRANTILLIGAIIAVAATGLWYLGKIEEPTAAMVSAVVTALAYYFALKSENKKTKGNGDVINHNSKIGNQFNNSTINGGVHSHKNPKS